MLHHTQSTTESWWLDVRFWPIADSANATVTQESVRFRPKADIRSIPFEVVCSWDSEVHQEKEPHPVEPVVQLVRTCV